MERGEALHSLSLVKIIERVSHDLETGVEDPAYGPGQVTTPDAIPPRSRSAAKDLVIETIGGIAAALGGQALGLD